MAPISRSGRVEAGAGSKVPVAGLPPLGREIKLSDNGLLLAAGRWDLHPCTHHFPNYRSSNRMCL